jgi:hypothetical protein
MLSCIHAYLVNAEDYAKLMGQSVPQHEAIEQSAMLRAHGRPLLSAGKDACDPISPKVVLKFPEQMGQASSAVDLRYA